MRENLNEKFLIVVCHMLQFLLLSFSLRQIIRFFSEHKLEMDEFFFLLLANLCYHQKWIFNSSQFSVEWGTKRGLFEFLAIDRISGKAWELPSHIWLMAECLFVEMNSTFVWRQPHTRATMKISLHSSLLAFCGFLLCIVYISFTQQIRRFLIDEWHLNFPLMLMRVLYARFMNEMSLFTYIL